MAEPEQIIIQLQDVDKTTNEVTKIFYPETIVDAIDGFGVEVRTIIEETGKHSITTIIVIGAENTTTINIPVKSGYVLSSIICNNSTLYAASNICKNPDDLFYTANVANQIPLNTSVEYKCIYLSEIS